MDLMQELKSKYPDIVGEITHSLFKNMIFIHGNIYTSSNQEEVKAFIKEELSKVYNSYLFIDELKINEFVVNSNKNSYNNNSKEQVLDELQIIYQGMLPINIIVENNIFRDKNVIMPENLQKIDNCVKVLNFIAPIILDSNLKIIDGNKRLLLAQANEIKEVPVVIINDCEDKALALSLVLNRSSEFQRWNFQEVDNYVDAHPQLQPILEPLGFFGRYVLPESFFADTILKYKIDPFNEKQKQYVQEEGLEEWAKYRRKQMAEESERKRKIKKKTVDKSVVSLFNLTPKKENFLETYDIDKEVKDFTDKYKELAGEITDANDAETKAKLRETGGKWQISNNTASQVAQRRRQEAIDYIQNSQELNEKEKRVVIENIDEFAEIYTDVDKVRELLDSEI